ncbi:MAG: hypothetical protein H6Q67_685 [Firmicutes bacterium]|nr:hypothetical protein [Bacillota bacterium]
MLFRERMGRFGSIVSLIAVTGMLAFFSLMLPEFLSSTVGRIFVTVWAAVAIIVFVAHARRVVGEKRKLPLAAIRFPSERVNRKLRTKQRTEKYRRQRG